MPCNFYTSSYRVSKHNWLLLRISTTSVLQYVPSVIPPTSCLYKIELQSGANDARADDTAWLKVAIAEWLNARRSLNATETSNTPPLSPRSKEERGINNDITGCLLCPIDYDWDNPECIAHISSAAQSDYFRIREKLRAATLESLDYDMGSNFFLRCLYKGEAGDPQFPLTGFLKGPLLTRISLYFLYHTSSTIQFVKGLSAYFHFTFICI